MLKAYKYRIYPNKEQSVLIAKTFGCVRYIYNQALALKIKSYQETKKSPSCFTLITGMLIHEKFEHDWLKEVHSQPLQMALRNLDNAFTKFFREKKGFPNFKNKHGKNSFQYPQGVTVDKNKIYLPKIGDVNIILHRKFNGKIKTVSVSRTPTFKYYVSILVDDSKETPLKKKVKEVSTIGIDLGLKSYITDSNGTKTTAPSYDLKRIDVLNKRLSRTKKGSQNRLKARLILSKQYEKITNQRKDFLHKLSSRLISENQTICIEDLNVKGMMKNHCLAKAIGNASWSEFVTMLTYKSEWYGKNLIQIGRFDPSSKLCSKCGLINENLQLKEREWTCDCGEKHDRDINTAQNIKSFGLITHGRNCRKSLLSSPVTDTRK
jgi:putative transposase